MMRTPDLTGRRFGMLVVLSQSVTDYKGRRQSICRCLCDCGREVDVRASLLCRKDGTAPKHPARSCGCARTLGDLTGRRFGRLTVLRESGRNSKGEITWDCVCDCGGSKVVSGAQLKSGFVISCGCAVADAHAKLASIAKVGSAASHTEEAIRKRTKTAFGDPGSEARKTRGENLSADLERTSSRVGGVNVASIMHKNPQGANPYRGVCWNSSKQRWMAYCCVRGIKWQSSRFRTAEEAKLARDLMMQELLDQTGADALVEKRKEYLKNKEE